MVTQAKFVPVRWDAEAKQIVCELPLTQPTGKVRVKRMGNPIATRKVPLRPDDELEWQIAYQDSHGNPVEFWRLPQLAYQYGLLDEFDLQKMQNIIANFNKFCDEAFAVEVETTSSEFEGFQLRWRKHPVLRRELRLGSELEAAIEIEIRHRQRAIGFQPMIFLLVPLRRCKPSDLLGRPAKLKERAYWSPSKAVLIALIHAFSIASRSYQRDMVDFVEKLVSR